MVSNGMLKIRVSDFKKSLDFYHKALGFKIEQEVKGKWAELSGNDMYIGLKADKSVKPKKRGSAGNISLGFEATGGIDKEAARLKKMGIKVEADPKADGESDWRFAWFKDPDGNEIYLWE